MSTELSNTTVSQELMFDPKHLTKENIKKFLCPTATEQELTLGLQIAKTFNLSPLKREIYFVKYGNNPMTVLTGYEVYLKRAERSGKYAGMRSWTEGSIEGKDLKGLVEVYVKGWDKPLVHEVDYSEYVQRKADGSINKFWATKPKTMIKKVAISQAFRMAFPDEFDGLPYTSDEVNNDVQAPVKYAETEQIKPLIVDKVAEAEIVAPGASVANAVPVPEAVPEHRNPLKAKKAVETPDPVKEVEEAGYPVEKVELQEGEKLAQGFITTPPKVAQVKGDDDKPRTKYSFTVGDTNYGTFDKKIHDEIMKAQFTDDSVKTDTNVLFNIVYKDRIKGDKTFHDIVRFGVASV